jgi:predicted flap endonuclease-1-like 5' DNA nuclease
MIFLAQSLAPWIAAALALGLCFGLRWNGAAAALVLFYVGGAGAAALRLAPGRCGFGLESAMLLFGAYGLGSAGAALLRRLFGPRALDDAPPAWIKLAEDCIKEAESLALASARAAAALDAAIAALERRVAPEPEVASKAPPRAAEPQGGIETPPHRPADWDSIHGLDATAAAALRAAGVANLDDLAGLTPQRVAELARNLGRPPAPLAYWAAQALLLVNGFETGFSRRRAGGDEAGPLDEAAALALLAALPQPAEPAAHDALYPGERPFGLLAPAGDADDLRRIEGIDENASAALNRLGIWTFRQIAAWSADNVRWIDSWLADPGRVGRESWREQAALLAARGRGNGGS